MAMLVQHGMMPQNKADRKALEKLDPYELRAKGLDEELSPHELGRALFHLHQRRGFKSNRKTDGGNKESGPVKEGIAKLRAAMNEAGARTCGEFLALRHRDRLPVRSRNVSDKITKTAYDFYPTRELAEGEFDLIWEAQSAYHVDLTEEARQPIKAVIFRQRPLRPVQPGMCTLNPDEDRAPWALPLTQRFRILRDIGNLTIARPGAKQRKPTLDERDILLSRLLGAKAPTFASLRKALNLDPDEYFNLEGDRCKDLKGDETAAALSHKDRFGKKWRDLPVERQQQIVEMLLAEENEERLIAWLMDECGLDPTRATRVSAAPLPQGYARLGQSALTSIVDAFMNKISETHDPDTGEVYHTPLAYDQAVYEAGFHHSGLDQRSEDELLARLPYYGDVLARHVVQNHAAREGSQEKRGRIANPTVHIGLNQLRKVINAIIASHGPPDEIVVELSRDLKMGKKQKDKVLRQQTQNQKANEVRANKMADIGIADPSGLDFLKMRLWEELDPEDAANRRCPYTGEPINLQELFSPAVEVEHILPFRRTLDNSPINKTVSMRSANREKGNQSPFEAFGDSSIGYDWEDICNRAGRLPANKRWRFQPDAMERFENEEQGFLDRQLADTHYLARISKIYLGHVCPANKVWVIPGRLTAMLRGKWGLNALLPDHNVVGGKQAKNRTDHRHHAIDAFVVACTARGLLQRIASASDQLRERLIDKMPEPFPGYDRDELQRIINDIVVSHRPNHGKAGKLHKETAYGLVRNLDKEDGYNLVYRKPFATLNEREVERIRDPKIREDLAKHLYQAKTAGHPHKDAMASFAAEHNIRRVRLLKKEKDVIVLTDNSGSAYKAYSPSDNHCVEIFELSDGKWQGEGISVFDANQRNHTPNWRCEHPDARLVMRVHKGDLLALEYGGNEQVMVVKKLHVSMMRIHMAPNTEAGNFQKRHKDDADPFRWVWPTISELPTLEARKVRVDELGRVWNVREAQ